MNKLDLQIKCTHCGRFNWHELERCAWCNRKLPRHNWFWHGMAAIAVVSMIAVAVRLAS